MRTIDVLPTIWRVRGPRQYGAYLFMLVCLVAAVVFVALPGAVDEKTQQALHGLCAQRPSHSYWLGNSRLPFDARMTGIYGGGAISLAILVARGRLHAFARPNWPVTVLLTAFVVAMAVDGTNSLLLDMGAWHPYEPRNEIRLVTGLLTGISLAATLCFLVGATFWQSGRRNLAIVENMTEIFALVAATIPFGLLVATGPGWLYAPVALFLLASAVVVVTVLAMVMLTIATRRDGTYRGLTELGLPASVAIVIAVVVIGAIAGGRYWLEHTFGLPPLE
jgi:uncharacterized membrane protein